MIKTTFRLSTTRYQLLLGHAHGWLAQRDPLALFAACVAVPIVCIAIVRALILSLPAAPLAAAEPTPALTILIATPTPALHVASTAVPTPDPLRSELENLRARVAELEAAPTPPPIVVVELAAPTLEPPAAPPAAEEPPAPSELDAAQQAERQQAIQDRLRGNGGSGKMVAPDFGPLPAASDTAAQWCAGAAASGIARCVEDQP